MPNVRRKCFISYHGADEEYVRNFVRGIDHTGDLIISRGLGAEMAGEIINSNDTDYVMRRIRERYLRDSTVTIVMMGRCTWARRYVDWEIQASLRRGALTIPNGIIGIKLPSFTNFPNRFNLNLRAPEDPPNRQVYARWIDHTESIDVLLDAIEAAYERRTTSASLIVNPRDRMLNNRQC